MCNINMYEKIIEKIESCGFLILRDNNIAAWEEAQQKIRFLPTQYLSGNLNYQEQYYKEKMPFYEDISAMIVKGGVVVGLWPLCIYSDYESNWKIGSYGSAIVKPLLVDDYYCKPKTLRSLWNSCLELLQECMIILHIKECIFQEQITGKVDVWHKKLMEYGASINRIKHRLYRNMQMDEKEVIKILPKSTMQDIKYGQQLYDAEIITKEDSDISKKFELFRKYHIKVSGRETRSKATWIILEENLKKSENFLVMLYDKKTREVVGISLFAVANAVATYAIAAYDRSRFDTCVSHVAQDAAIKYMRSIGIEWYELGERSYHNDPGTDSKNVNIGLFKEKFSTHMFCDIEWCFKGL